MKNFRTVVVATIARNIVAHVDQGGFLGASWPQYVSVFSPTASGEELAAAMAAAEKQRPTLWADSSHNFATLAEEHQGA